MVLDAVHEKRVHGRRDAALRQLSCFRDGGAVPPSAGGAAIVRDRGGAPAPQPGKSTLLAATARSAGIGSASGAPGGACSISGSPTTSVQPLWDWFRGWLGNRHGVRAHPVWSPWDSSRKSSCVPWPALSGVSASGWSWSWRLHQTEPPQPLAR